MSSTTDPQPIPERPDPNEAIPDPGAVNAGFTVDTATDQSDGEEPQAAASGRSAHIGRRLRALTGVDESILDCIPSERSRYSSLASVMIGTASFSGVSMYFALAEVLGSGGFWFVPLALGWAGFVLCLDRWLVSSSSGLRWRSRAAALAPRFVVAVFVGLVIAEPLVLRLFQPAIEAKVRQDRVAAITQLASGLMACNPLPGEKTTPARGVDCSELSLAIPVSPAQDEAQITQLTARRDNLKSTLDAENGQLTQLQNTVNNECNGTSGAGLTGKAGNGPACRQDEQNVLAFRQAHPIGQQYSDLATLENEINTAQANAQREEATFAADRKTQIAVKTGALAQPYDRIGLGERFDALLALSKSSGIIGVTSVLMRLFFILIDCLPVALKFFTGATAYDRLADQEISSAARIYQRATEANETVAGLRIETELLNVKAQEESKRARSEILHRNKAIESERNQFLEVDKLWAAKRARRSRVTNLSDTRSPDRDDIGASTADSLLPRLPTTRINGSSKVPRQSGAAESSDEQQKR